MAFCRDNLRKNAVGFFFKLDIPFFYAIFYVEPEKRFPVLGKMDGRGNSFLLFPVPVTNRFLSLVLKMTEAKQTPDGKNRMLWPDILRIIAMTGIVGYHVLELFPRLRTNDFLGVFTEFGTIIFVFLAGFFSLNSQKDRTLRQYYMSRFVSILLPYFWISLILLAGKCAASGVPSNVCMWIAKNLLLGGATPTLWFVPMITIFFLFAPFWNRLPRTIRLLLPGIGLLVTVFSGRGRFYELGKNSLYFVPFFMAGMECRFYRKTFEPLAAKTFPWSCVLLVLSLVLLYFRRGSPSLVLAKIMVSFVLIGGVIRLASAEEDGKTFPAGQPLPGMESLKETVSKISGCCYTVYLIHNTWIGVVLSPLFRRIPDQFKHLPLFLLTTVFSMIVLAAAVLAAKKCLLSVGIKKTRPLIGA